MGFGFISYLEVHSNSWKIDEWLNTNSLQLLRVTYTTELALAPL